MKQSIGENGARSVTGHIMSAGFPRELSTAGILLFRNICSFVLAVARYYQSNNMPATRLVQFGKVGFSTEIQTFYK